MHYFLTNYSRILRDRRSQRSRQISTLFSETWHTSPHSELETDFQHFVQTLPFSDQHLIHNLLYQDINNSLRWLSAHFSTLWLSTHLHPLLDFPCSYFGFQLFNWISSNWSWSWWRSMLYVLWFLLTLILNLVSLLISSFCCFIICLFVKR